MQVALVTDTFPPDLNGVALTMDRLRTGLEERGHRVRVVRPCGGTVAPRVRRRESGVRSLPVPGYPGLRFGLPSWLHLWRLWSRWRPDVVYVATEGPLGWAAASLARRLRIPVASGFHTNFDEYLRVRRWPRLGQLALSYLRRLHNATTMTLAPSPDVAKRLEASGFRNLHVLSRGVDADRFHPRHRDDSLRLSWGAAAGPGGPPVFLLVGRLAPEKNLSCALAAVERLTGGFGCCVVVGDGPDRVELERRFPFARFAGALRGAELARYYSSADVLLFPSLTETFGNVLLEAMASGLVTVSFDYAAAGQHIVDGRNGLKVPFGDQTAFAARTASALALSARQRSAMGAAARATAEALSWDQVVRRFEELLSAASSPIPESSVESPLRSEP